MKKILKIVAIFIVILAILTISNLSLGYKKQVSKPETELSDEYKKREMEILGLKIPYRDKVLFSGENNQVTEQEKEENNIIIGIFGGALVIYWLILLFLYEKEDIYYYTGQEDDDMEILKKYNPMLAGCLVDNRQVLSRDLTAVVLNLIQKQVINMEMVPTEKGKENYIYMVSENKNSEVQLDEIERYVLSWIFGFYEEKKVDLIKKLKELSKRKDFIKNIKNLNTITQKKLNEIGANIHKVPLFLRIINIFLVMFTIAIVTVHIINNGLSVNIYQTTYICILIIAIAIIAILPIVAFIIHLLLFTTVIFKKMIKNTIIKYNGKEIVITSVMIVISMFIVMLVMYFIVPNKYICLDIFVIGMSVLIVKTDNLMTKHSPEIMQDYYSLQAIKTKIEEYTLIKDEQINYMKLWEEYLIYAVAFGIPVPIVSKLKDTQREDEDIKYLLKCESLYYISKAYLEVMWDMDFKKKKINI